MKRFGKECIKVGYIVDMKLVSLKIKASQARCRETQLKVPDKESGQNRVSGKAVQLHSLPFATTTLVGPACQIHGGDDDPCECLQAVSIPCREPECYTVAVNCDD